MQVTRRAFSQGIGGLFGARFVPGGKAIGSVLPAEPGIDDAYAKLLGEYIRVEEVAIAAGRTAAAQAGAATWEGRQLEGFIAELDGRVDIKTTARQIYAEFKERFRAEAAKMRERLEERVKAAISDDDRAVDADPIEEGVSGAVDRQEQAIVERPAVSGQPDLTEAGDDMVRLS